MTSEEIEKLEGIDLARACAEAMGWRNTSNNVYRMQNGNFRIASVAEGPEYFSPQSDHNHAAELRAWACAKWPVVRWFSGTTIQGDSVNVRFTAISDFRTFVEVEHSSECVATCKAFLELCEVMNGGGK